MKKSVIVCMVAVVLISIFVGCSVKNSDVNENAETSSFSASKETRKSLCLIRKKQLLNSKQKRVMKLKLRHSLKNQMLLQRQLCFLQR